MCSGNQFKCVRTLLKLDLKDPNVLVELLKRHPCMKACVKWRKLAEALETIKNLEEVDMAFRAGLIG